MLQVSVAYSRGTLCFRVRWHLYQELDDETYVFFIAVGSGDDGWEIFLAQEVTEERHVGLVLVILLGGLIDVGNERSARVSNSTCNPA